MSELSQTAWSDIAEVKASFAKLLVSCETVERELRRLNDLEAGARRRAEVKVAALEAEVALLRGYALTVFHSGAPRLAPSDLHQQALAVRLAEDRAEWDERPRW